MTEINPQTPIPQEDSDKEISEAIGIIQLCTVRYKVRLDIRYKASFYEEGLWICKVMGKNFSNSRFSEMVRLAVAFVYKANEPLIVKK